MDTISTNQRIRELTVRIATAKLNAHVCERELRSETTRWAWSVAIWEMTRAAEGIGMDVDAPVGAPS